MAKQKPGKSQRVSGDEPVFIIRPAFKNYGLDYLHITLIALAIILIVLAFALSTFKQGVVISNCQYGANSNGICNMPMHNSTQVLAAAEKELASYSSINTSLSLLPYFSLVNQSNVSYLAQSRQWLVVIPYIYPYNHSVIYNMSLLLYDSNLSLVNSFIQTLHPSMQSNNSVVALGTVSIYGESACKASVPIPIYIVTDPYAPGALDTLSTMINVSKQYGNKINTSYFFIFSGYSIQYYGSFGVDHTQQLGRYLECASRQDRYSQFLSNLSIAYNGKPMENQTLYDIVLGSQLNTTQFSACMQNVSRTLDIEAEFANLYHIVSTPTIIVNCRYSTIPQSINYAINYSLDNLNG
jgi:hypothetical protein